MNQNEVDVYFDLAQHLNRMEVRRLMQHIDMHEESVIKNYIEPFEQIDYKALVENEAECFDFIGSILNEIGAYAKLQIEKEGKVFNLVNFLLTSIDIVLEHDINELTFHRLKIYILLKVMFELNIVKKDWLLERFNKIYCSGVIDNVMFYNRPIIKYKELINYLPELNDEDTIDSCKFVLALENTDYLNVIFEGID